MKMMEHLCEGCNTLFSLRLKRYNYAIKNHHKLYCTNECAVKSKVRSIKVNCAFCNKPLIKNFSTIKKSKSGNLFCNRSCATSFNNREYKAGANNPNYKFGRASYRNKISLEACNRCGYKKYLGVLEVHHKDRNRKNNSVDNLECLCPNCHKEEHYLTKTGLFWDRFRKDKES